MVRKYLTITAACVMTIATMTACGEKHTHETGAWQLNGSSHWKVCTSCEEKVDEAEHTLNDENTCTDCGAQIWEFDESISVSLYNENGDPLKVSEYDKEGNAIYDLVYSYEYDAEGNYVKSTETTDGILTGENEYVLVDGISVISKYTGYMEDGSKFVNEYDENGNVIVLISYDAEGNVDMQSESEYAMTDDGEWYESKCTTCLSDGSKTIVEYDRYRNTTSAIFFDTEGNVETEETWEYEYDMDGNITLEKHFQSGRLVSETQYKFIAGEDYTANYPETVTEYHEDGTTTVTVYDENGEVIS